MMKMRLFYVIILLVFAAACQAAPTPPSPAVVDGRAATLEVLAIHTAAVQTMAAAHTPTPAPTQPPAAAAALPSASPTAMAAASATPAPQITSLPTMADVPILPVGAGARRLEQPIAVVRDGIILAVEQVAVYPDRVELVYTLRNLPAEMLYDPFHPVPGTDCGGPDSYPSLRLPDGTLVPAAGYLLDGKAYDTIQQPFARQYAVHLFPAAVPAGEQELQMILPCIALARLDRAPQNWVIPFRVQ